MDMAASALTSQSSSPKDENVTFEVACSSSISLASAIAVLDLQKKILYVMPLLGN